MLRYALLPVSMLFLDVLTAQANIIVSGSGGVLSGAIVAAPEWVAPYTWGDGIHDLTELWSAGMDDASGFAYGLSVPGSQTDVYNAGVVDPLSVADAASFIYTDGAISFMEGETLFFRGSNGYYGAWVVGDLYPSGASEGPTLYMNGTWYFQPDGTGDFTTSLASVPEPGTGFLAALGLVGLAAAARRTASARRRA